MEESRSQTSDYIHKGIELLNDRCNKYVAGRRFVLKIRIIIQGYYKAKDTNILNY